MKLGARIIKTGIAVSLTMFICKVFSLEPAFFGAVSAVVNMQPSIFLTLKTSRDQIAVHILGVAVGLGCGYVLGGSPLVMGLATILIIAFYLRLRLTTSVTAGVVAALFILSSSQDQFLSHALARTLVIFTGMGTAMVINVAILPPRYQEQFIAKLQEGNERTVARFEQAVHVYVYLGDLAPDYHLAEKNLVIQINKEARALFMLVKREGGWLASAEAEHREWLAAAERLMDYNETLAESADRIYELVSTRYDRRMAMQLPPITQEFAAILAILVDGVTAIARVNTKLRAALIDRADADIEEINESYWERLLIAIEQWQTRQAGNYYLHTLLEALVAANEIKWAARQAKKILHDAVLLNRLTEEED